MKIPDLRTKVQKKAEVKLQAVGAKIGNKVREGKKKYDAEFKKKNDKYLATPRGRRAIKLYEAGGSY